MAPRINSKAGCEVSRENMYMEFRSKFPDIAKEVDEIVIDEWSDLEIAGTFIWFELFAKLINRKMNKADTIDDFKDLFEFFRRNYMAGVKDVKACIDVGVIENLFWNVSSEKSSYYWKALPDVFKDLYVNFHLRPPE